MSLADIEQKIIKDSEKEAAQILVQSRSEQTKRLDQLKAGLARERKQNQQSAEHGLKQSLDQKKQLFELEAGQKYLQAKRQHLQKLFSELKEEILAKEKLLQEFVVLLLKELEPILSAEETVKIEGNSAMQNLVKPALSTAKKVEYISKKDWADGRLEIILSNSRLDCSIPLFLEEKFKILENKIAEKLFGK